MADETTMTEQTTLDGFETDAEAETTDDYAELRDGNGETFAVLRDAEADKQIMTDGGRDLPAIEETGDHTTRCAGCGRDGLKGPDGEPVILHARECPHSAEYCDECGRHTDVPDTDDRHDHRRECSKFGEQGGDGLAAEADSEQAAAPVAAEGDE